MVSMIRDSRHRERDDYPNVKGVSILSAMREISILPDSQLDRENKTRRCVGK